jgi:ABC-type Mn2+/Zn2+ transport system ATPase subunit
MAASVAPSAVPLIAEAVTVTAGGLDLIHEVTLRVAPAQIVCLLGPNGGGKTTFLKAALGLLPMRIGRIALFGEAPEAARTSVGYVPQRQGFDRSFPATASELIVAHLRGRWPMRVSTEERGRVRAALQRVSGESLLDRPIASLSGGESQRVFLARALVRAPRLLLLDEPMAGADERGRADFLGVLQELRAAGVAILLVTHSRVTAGKLADHVYYLDRVVRAEGPPDRALASITRDAQAHDERDHGHAAGAPHEEDEWPS